jgi:hypothetical protein
MAVDTRNKRAWCVNLALPFGRVNPTPDGSLNTVSDRAQMAYSYAIGAVVTVTFNPIWASNSNRAIGITLESD